VNEGKSMHLAVRTSAQRSKKFNGVNDGLIEKFSANLTRVGGCNSKWGKHGASSCLGPWKLATIQLSPVSRCLQHFWYDLRSTGTGGMLSILDPNLITDLVYKVGLPDYSCRHPALSNDALCKLHIPSISWESLLMYIHQIGLHLKVKFWAPVYTAHLPKDRR